MPHQPEALCPLLVNRLEQEHPQPELRHLGYKYNMILNEIYSRSPEAYQDVSQDNSQPQLGELRKTRLTLKQIRKLRQMNDVRGFEYKEKLKQIRQQYAPPVAPPAL